MTKYSNEEVVAAVRALLRRRQPGVRQDLIRQLRQLLARPGTDDQIVKLVLHDPPMHALVWDWLDASANERGAPSGPERRSRASGTRRRGLARRPVGRLPGLGGRTGEPEIIFSVSNGGQRAGPATGARPQAKAAGPRWLQTQVRDTSGSRPVRLTRGFRANAPHEIAVAIAPRQRGWLIASGGPSIDDQLPRGTYELTIVFFVPSTNETQVATVALPRTGPTQERRFPFSAPERGAEVTILISVVYKGRTIQAAELTGIAAEDPQRASARIGFRIAVPTPRLEVLHVRESFDSTLRIASAPDGRMVGVVTTEPPQTVALRGFGDAPLGIRDLLTEMATSAPAVQHLDSDESVKLLGNLALLGGQLNATLADESHDLLHTRKVKRIQIVQSDPDLFLPIEFVYDLPPPAEPAKLCDNWKLALEEGTCSASFHEVNELGNLKQVCPSGFWAISKIIERQSVTPMLSSELSGASAAMWSDPVPRRKRLPEPRAAVFAWSTRVDNNMAGQSEKVLASLKTATGGNAYTASTWKEWVELIENRRPNLLVLLSHTTGDNPARIQIGADTSSERRSLVEINDRFVKAAATDTPVVLLLGCDTTGVDRQAFSFAKRFRDKGAAVVVGTLSSVLGEHAAPVASGLVAALSESTVLARKNRTRTTFGEIWRRARGKLLAQGELTALCVTAYGDAGWLV